MQAINLCPPRMTQGAIRGEMSFNAGSEEISEEAKKHKEQLFQPPFVALAEQGVCIGMSSSWKLHRSGFEI